MRKSQGACALPPKELSLFKRIVKYYDQKQYKTGLKFANHILSNPKYSEHGETLSMKGILLNCMGKKEEARDLVKRGLRSNLQSFVCWHIYGLIMKTDRKYDEAIRCYLQALKLDPNNLQVLRDLSVLQMHTRDLDGCRETRSKLLNQRPNQKASWVGFVVIQHFIGDLDGAERTISAYIDAQANIEPYNYEHSELLMYYINILIENNKLNDALTFMEAHSKDIIDQVSFLESHASLLLKLGKREEAEKEIWKLLDRNPENKLYYDLLFQAQSLQTCDSLDDTSLKKTMLQTCLEKFPTAKLPKLLRYETLRGDEFENEIDDFLRCNLRKGVPTLFVQVKRFYKLKEKRIILENLYLTYRENLDKKGTLGPVRIGKSEPKSIDVVIEPPSTSLWLNYLIANHYNYVGNQEQALNIISEELERNPTIVDLYVLKAEIFRDAGDVLTASRWMEEAQSLDTADRFINALCTKFMVQAQRLEDAEAMASKFTRGSSTAAAYLSEMQCMWFLIENARALLAMSKYGDALKLCHEIDRHYSAILEDQLDFHSYCLRKGTLQSYVDTVRLEDRLRDHPAYFDSASLAIEMYLYLHSNPLGEQPESTEATGDNITSSEMKKLRNKQRRAERRAEAEAQRSKADQERRDQALKSRQNAADKETVDSERPPESEELDPKRLARPDDALSEAARFLQPLVDLSNGRIETHCLAYEVYERKEKRLLMLRSIRRGLDLPGAIDNPWFHECITRFLNFLARLPETPESLVYEILMQETRSMLKVPSKTPLPSGVEYNEEFLQRNNKSFKHVFHGILTKTLLNVDSAAVYLAQLPKPCATELGEVTWTLLLESLELLKKYATLKMAPVTDQFIEEFRAGCAERYPLAAVFLTRPDWEELRRVAIESAAATAINGAYPERIVSTAAATTATGDIEFSNVENHIADDLAAINLSTNKSAVVGNGTVHSVVSAGGKRKKGGTAGKKTTPPAIVEPAK